MSYALGIVGAGPGGLAPLFAAASEGMLPQLLSRGVLVLERSNAPGAGLLKDVVINSDSAAEAFLDILAQSKEPDLVALLQHPLAVRIAERRGESVPLAAAAGLLQIASQTLLKIVSAHPGCAVLLGSDAVKVRRKDRMRWEITSLSQAGMLQHHTTHSVHLATGAHQPHRRLEEEYVAGQPLLPAFGAKLMQTGELFTAAGEQRLHERLAGKQAPKIVIVGGSTSAGAAAAYLLRRTSMPLGPGGVTIMHRSPLRLYYPSVSEAKADGYSDFTPEDVCPITGRVFRLSGFRFDSKEILRNSLAETGESADPRLALFCMAGQDEEAQQLLAGADLIIAALGYIPRMIDVRDEQNAPIALHTPRSGDWAMVDQQCTVRTAQGESLPGLTAMGLSVGPAASREMGGEAGFRGQVNSLWLWQNRLGLRVAQAAVKRADASNIPFLRPQPPRLSEHVSDLQALEHSGVFTNFGPVNTRLEQELLDQFFDGKGACTTVCNATLALMLAIRNAIGNGPVDGRLALMPSFTFAAAAQAASWCGLTPLFCDIDPDTWLPCQQSETALLERYGDRIAVMVPNGTFGNSLDVRRYEALQESTGIPVVIDAAACLGSLDHAGNTPGAGSKLPVVYSMHATKSFATGEGGLLYSADAELISRFKAMASFGFQGSRVPVMPGLNAKMSEVAALTAQLQLQVYPQQVSERTHLDAMYAEMLRPEFRLQVKAGRRQVRTFQSIVLPSSAATARNEIRAALAAQGVQTGTYFSPHLAQSDYMRSISICPALPASDDVASRIVSLPLYLGMQHEDVAWIVRALHDCVEQLAPPASNSVMTQPASIPQVFASHPAL